MIFIHSIQYDGATNLVVQYLLHHKASFVRFNHMDGIKNVKIELNNTKESIKLEDNKGREIELIDIRSYWYRRGEWNFAKPWLEAGNKDQVYRLLSNEERKIKAFLHNILGTKKVLGCIDEDRWHDKLFHLYLARNLEISIPSTIVSGMKKDLEFFIHGGIPCITKAISDMFEIVDKDNIVNVIATKFITSHNLVDLGDTHLPTLLQKYVEKIFEVRIFYLKERFFSMAIFSQQDAKTKLDYRSYNREKPNRNVPYNLPEKFEKKLLKLTKAIGWKSGSIDLIVTPDNDHVFLEINPIGQFGALSNKCNYYIEKRIANYLIQN